MTYKTNPRRNARRNVNTKPLVLFLFAGLVFCFQVLINVIAYGHFNLHQSPDDAPLLQETFDQLDKKIQDWKEQLKPSYKDDGNFVAFTIRDSKRLVPTQIPSVFFVYDYVDIYSPTQNMKSAKSKLYLNTKYVGDNNCPSYDVFCYKQKILQVLYHLYTTSNATYFFYMEADNDLCVPLEDIRNLTYHYQRYFISTGIGFSGWIMRRDFVRDFYKVYKVDHKQRQEAPDPIGAVLLMEKKAWSVTRQYLVSHTILPSFGAKALTVGRNETEGKHLPRCFEPRRSKWPISQNDTRDKYGWDFFDYDLCEDSEIFPCAPGQIESLNITASINDTIRTEEDVLQLEALLAQRRQNQMMKGNPGGLLATNRFKKIAKEMRKRNKIRDGR
jgi:hypothetical protein